MEQENTQATDTDNSQASQDATNTNDGVQSSVSQPDEGKTDAFNADQQAKVQELIDTAYNKAYKKAQAEAQKKLEATHNDIKATEKATNKKPDPVEQDKVVEALEQRAINAEETAEKLKAQTVQTQKQQALLNAIGKHNVTDINMIMNTVMGNVDIDEDGRMFVKNENGNPTFDVNTGGKEYLSLDSFVANWLNERPFMLKGNQAKGSGSQNALFGTDGKLQIRTTEDVRNMSDEQFSALRKEGIELKTSRGQTMNFGESSNDWTKSKRRNKFKG